MRVGIFSQGNISYDRNKIIVSGSFLYLCQRFGKRVYRGGGGDFEGGRGGRDVEGGRG